MENKKEKLSPLKPQQASPTKRPSRVIDLEDKRFQVKEKKKTNHNYGQLKFGTHQDSNYKIALRTFFGNPQSEVCNLKFDETDKYIASCNTDGSIKIFNLQEGKLAYNLQGSTGSHQTPTTQVAWKPKMQSKALYTANADGSLVVWNTITGQFIEKVTEQNQLLTIEFNSEGNKFITAGKDYHVRLYDDETLKVEHDFIPQEYEQIGHSNRVFATKCLHDQPNIFISGGWDGTICIWDIRTKQAVGQIAGPSISGGSLDYKNGKILAGSYRNQDQLEIYDFKKRQKIDHIKWNENADSDKAYCYCAQFSKFGNDTILAGCTGENQLKLFDVKKNNSIAASVIDQHEGIYTCDYANTSNRFAFAGGEGVVYIMGLTDLSDI